MLSILVVLYAFICYFIWFLGLTYYLEPSASLCFSLFLSFIEKEYQMESNWPENLRWILWTRRSPRSKRVGPEESRPNPKTGGSALPPGRVLLSCRWLVDPPDLFPTPKIPINIEAPRNKPRLGVPPPQASVPTKNQSGPCSGTLWEGGIITGGHLHHPGALHDE